MFTRLLSRYTLVKLNIAVLIFIFLLLVSRLIPTPDYSKFESKTVTVTGTVSSMEEKSNGFGQSQLIIGLKKANVSCQQLRESVKGVLLEFDASLLESREIKMGERINVSGQAQNFSKASNIGEFDSFQYYLSLGYCFRIRKCRLVAHSVHHDMTGQFLFESRSALSKIIDVVCKEDSGIMHAMLLGDKSKLTPQQKEIFKDGGIGHVLAISGLHISFLGIGIYSFLKKFLAPKFWFIAALLSGVVMIMYGIMTGGSPSAIRSIVMFVLHLLSDSIGRTYERLTALSIAAVTLCLFEPRLIFQTGFLLSFGAILGIELIYPALMDLSGYYPGSCTSNLEALLQGMFISLSVSIMTFPVLISSYYQFPVYSFLLNIVVVPMMGLLMTSGIVACILGCIGLIFLSGIAFFPGHLCIKICTLLCSLSLKLPGSVWITGKPQWWQVAIYYGLVLALLLMIHHDCVTKAMGLGIMLVAALVVSRAYTFSPTLYMLNAGQGDAIIIRDNYHHTLLIDGGSSDKKKLSQYVLLPALKAMDIDTVDAIIFSHTDNDHISGSLELLEDSDASPIRIKRVILPPAWASVGSQGFEKIRNACQSGHIPVSTMVMGDSFQLGRIKARALWPDFQHKSDDINGNCLVLKMDMGFSVLLTGDLDGSAEETFVRQNALMKNNLHADVLKIGHHGSKVSSQDALLRACVPGLALISVGKNSYGHPSPQTISRILDSAPGIHIFRTDQSGQISFNGRKITSYFPTISSESRTMVNGPSL